MGMHSEPRMGVHEAIIGVPSSRRRPTESTTQDVLALGAGQVPVPARPGSMEEGHLALEVTHKSAAEERCSRR